MSGCGGGCARYAPPCNIRSCQRTSGRAVTVGEETHEFEEQETKSNDALKGSERSNDHHCHYVCCILYFVVILVLALLLWGFLPYYVGTGEAYDKFLKPDHLFEYTTEGLDPITLPKYIWWPGCTKVGAKTQAELNQCALPCFSPSLIPTITAFNGQETFAEGRMNAQSQRSDHTQNHFLRVNYTSRPDQSGKTVMLSGWLLPGNNNHVGYTPARIVIQHGFNSNSNKWPATLMAYFLRSMGFDVLINNLRDHGYSAKTSDITTWGHVYHYDLLGAWDYLREDPQSILSPSNHSVNPAKVGILGISMGALVALNAFTLDQRVPAVWADSPPASSRQAFDTGFENQEGIAAIVAKVPFFKRCAWHWLNSKAGVDLDTRSPLKDIPTCPVGANGPRHMQFVMNQPDRTVKFSGVEELVKIARNYPDQYVVEEPYYTNALCNKQDHIVSGLLQPEAYRQKLCIFWTKVFNIAESMCELSQLPTFNKTTARRALMASAKDIDVNDVIV